MRSHALSVVRWVMLVVLSLAAACGDNIRPDLDGDGGDMIPDPGDSAKDITRFSINGVDGTIVGTDIAVALPFGTDATSLVPTIVHTGASVAPDSGVAQDFTASREYVVTAIDGSTKSYIVTVSIASSSAKDITQFSILGIDGTIGATTVALTLPFGTDLTALTPTIVHTGASIAPASGEVQDFSAPRTYTVTAADGSTKDYTVTVGVATNSSKDITQFTILGIDGTIGANTISLTLPFGSSLTALTPTVVHTGVSVSPASGATQDFSGPVIYTVVAADGTMKPYTVTVSVAPNSSKDITRFTILGVDGTIGTNTISLTLPFGTNLSLLTPAIIHTGASVSPPNASPQDFTVPRTYTVTAADGSTKDYVVTVSVALNSSKDITRFTILGVDGIIDSNSVALTLPFGTDLSSLTPTIEHTGASISPPSGIGQSFTAPRTYTVTAADGSTKDYTVTVTAAPSSSKDITRFTILGVDGTIGASTISLTLPFGTSLASLVPTIVHTGASVSPASGVAQSFSVPRVYRVTAADGSTKDYIVTVTVARDSSKDITRFTILGVDGTIGANTITVTLPFGTSLTSLTPTIVHTGTSISPGTGVAQNFSLPRVYTVTAADGSTKTYTVTVTTAPNNSKDITRFTVLGIDGIIGTDTISVVLPFGSSVTSLSPLIVHTGVSVFPGSSVAQDFSTPRTYTVTAADGSTKTYTVTVTVGADTAKDITRFTILGTDGTIGTDTITLTLPFGTSLTSLTPTIVHTGVSLSPASGTAQDFSGPRTYTVTAADGSTKSYLVTVSVALDSSKDITQFTILGIDGTIGANTISLTVPFGTSLASLTPTIVHTGASVSPGSGAAQSFTSPRTYTVTAADGSTKDYVVTVSVALNSAKDITQFTILGVDGTIGANTITLTVPFGTDPSSLTPTIVHTGVSVSPASGLAQDFTLPRTYTVTAADGSTKQYVVTVSIALDSSKDITQFTILGIDGTIGASTISLVVPFGTDLSSLTPTIVHTGVSVDPGSGIAEDFSSPVTYTVTASDGSTKDYLVTVTAALNSAKDITQFTILGIDGTIGSNTVTLTVPFGTSLASLTPTIVHTGASIAPASGVALDFTSPRTYVVTAADGSTKSYMVTVTAALNSAKDITRFTILGIDGDIGTNTVSLTVPFGTSLAALTPTIEHTGVSIAPASGISQDFSAPVTYVVSAADGSTKSYVVTVSVALNSAKDITQFTILGIDGTIGTNTITLTVPFGTNRAALTPTIVHTGASVSPDSGSTQDFTTPRTYTVTAADGSTKTYTVTVSVAPSSSKDITQFTILGIDGVIGADTIALTVPFGTNLASLTPTIIHTGVSVSPDSGVANDFSSPTAYTVTAADGSTKTYVVTVTAALNSAKDITQFTILGVDGIIGTNTISLTLPFGTSLASLTPTIVHTGVSVSPASGVAQDFSAPRTYTVTAANGTTKAYTVTVTIAPNSSKDITQFTILGIDGTIGTNTISLVVPFGTSLTSLTPTIVHTGVSISPASGVAQNFSTPRTYTVTAADGSTKTYTVTVTAAPSSEKDIIAFAINGVDAIITGTSITLTLPFNTPLTALSPVITHTGVSVSPGSGVPNNFTTPRPYTVTAADGSTKTFTVTVSLAISSDKDIIRFTINGIEGAIATTSPTTGVVTLNMPNGTNLASLTPVITINGVSITPASGVPRDFRNPVTYTVFAADGSSKVYTVTVGTVNGNGTKLITDFSILGVHGSITNGASTATITLVLPAGTDLSLLTPTIIINASSVSPPSRVARNFTTPVTYTATAANGDTRVYTVTVTTL